MYSIWDTCHSGNAHVLITNSSGERLGFVGDQFVDEMSGGYTTPILGGAGIETEPIYSLPLTDTYTILVDGQVLTQTEGISVTQFGPGYATSLVTTFSPSQQGELVISSDGTSVSYQAGSQPESPTVGLALEHGNENYLLEVGNADVNAGQSISLSADKTNKKFNVDASQAAGGAYDLTIEKTSSSGQEAVSFSGIAISAGDTQIINYGTASQEDGVVVNVDQGSDGDIDNSFTLGGPAPVTPDANFTANPMVGTAPLTVTFTAATTATVNSLKWSYGDGQTDATGLSHTHIYQNAGTFTATLTVTTTGGVDVKSKIITVNAKPTNTEEKIYLPIIIK